MAMDGTALGDAIADIIMSPQAPESMKRQIKAQWEKIGEAIVGHIQENAEVPAGIAVSTAGGAGQTTATGKVQ